jgi:hypothetical protein
MFASVQRGDCGGCTLNTRFRRTLPNGHPACPGIVIIYAVIPAVWSSVPEGCRECFVSGACLLRCRLGVAAACDWMVVAVCARYGEICGCGGERTPGSPRQVAGTRDWTEKGINPRRCRRQTLVGFGIDRVYPEVCDCWRGSNSSTSDHDGEAEQTSVFIRIKMLEGIPVEQLGPASDPLMFEKTPVLVRVAGKQRCGCDRGPYCGSRLNRM